MAKALLMVQIGPEVFPLAVDDIWPVLDAVEREGLGADIERCVKWLQQVTDAMKKAQGTYVAPAKLEHQYDKVAR